jgi:AcrR family transcriptional regulator
MKDKPKRADLREACVAEAFRIVEEQGVEQLSLREVARRLGISHQAPYRHFASRDHILAEIIARSFEEFAAYLNGRAPHPLPHDDLREMGLHYMTYARLHPLKYRLMFNTPMPDPKSHPRMTSKARHAFAILADRLEQVPLRPLAPSVAPSAKLEALFVWSLLHGLASILQSDVLPSLKLTAAEKKQAIAYCFARLGQALQP